MGRFACGFSCRQYAENNKRTFFPEKTSTKSPGQGQVNRGSLAVCVVVNPAVTELDPAGTDAAPPIGSVAQAYTSTLHHEKGF